MALLQWLKKEGFGTYAAVEEFQGELGRRSTQALGALGAALAAIPADLGEVAQGQGQGICAEVVRDLRVPKGARVAALRALMLGGMGSQLPRVFAGAFDLMTDPRLPEADRAYLGKNGLKAFLQSLAPDLVNVELARGAAAAEKAVLAAGPDAIREVLAEFPPNHTPAITLRFAAFNEPLAPELEARWIEVLSRQFRAAKNAPPAAKRLGTAPEWPPIVAEVMRPMLPKAEAATPAATKAPGPTAAVAPATISGSGTGDDKRLMPALRPRARSGPEDGFFVADGVPVAPGSQRAEDAPAPARGAPKLQHIALGPQIELLANRGTRALERFIASFDVRAGRRGVDKALEEVARAATLRGATNVNEHMLDELFAFATNPKTPSSWRRAVKTVLEFLGPDRHAALPAEQSLKDVARARSTEQPLNRPR